MVFFYFKTKQPSHSSNQQNVCVIWTLSQLYDKSSVMATYIKGSDIIQLYNTLFLRLQRVVKPLSSKKFCVIARAVFLPLHHDMDYSSVRMMTVILCLSAQYKYLKPSPVFHWTLYLT